MIQDIAPCVYDNAYNKKQDADGSCFAVFFHNQEILVKWMGEEISYPTFEEVESVYPDVYKNCQYLFAIDEKRFYLIQEEKEMVCEDCSYEKTEIFRRAQPRSMAFAGVTASQIARWYANHKFCGRCGKPMVHSQEERMMHCPDCGNAEYPKICPAVIVAVTDDNRLLMSRYAGRSYKKYALLAGFTEVGETIEETISREVMEEVGIKVKNIRYYKSQPWSFSDTLLFGFYCDLDGEDTITLDQEELAMAAWFEREEIPVSDPEVSLTNEMILKFKNNENI